jgi:hypothetical protein
MHRFPLKVSSRIQCAGPAIFLVAWATTLGAQQQPSQGVNKSDIPEHTIYHEFFRHLLFLDRQAATRQALTAGGQSNAAISQNSYQIRTGLTGAQFEMVRTTAREMEEQVDALDARAKTIVDAFRAAHRQASPQQPLPPAPPELAQLQKQRDDLMRGTVAQLKAGLGPQAAGQLDRFLATQFAPHVRVALVGQRPHNPAQNRVAPFERIN